MKWRFVAVLLSVLLVLGLPFFQPTAHTAQRAIVQSYSVHDPIDIGDNTEFTNASGVVWGSGTQSDPYIIEGWEIDISDDHAIDGIRIWDTDAHFIVRDVYIHSIVAAANSGISLHSTANGTIMNVSLEGPAAGVSCPSFVNNTVVEKCIIRNCTTGCAVYDSHNISVVNNTFSGNEYGLQFADGDNITASGNSFAANTWRSIDISRVNDSVVLDNNIVKSSGYGVNVGHCRNVTIQYNVIDSTNQTTNGCGIYVIETTSSRVNFNKMTSQNLPGSPRALGIDFSSHIQVVGNRIEREDPLAMWHCNNISVYHNSFVTVQLVYLSNVTDSVWDNGYPNGGNFWSIYSGWDWMSGPAQNMSGPDGIGDSPWQLDMNNNTDYYPLMTDSLVPNTPPTASFAISPTWGDTAVNFLLDASSSTDNQTLFNGLQVRWDFDGNGEWDTSWSTNKTADHKFADAGNYTVKLEAKDGGGLTAVIGVNLTVNETEEDLSDLLSDPVIIVAIIAVIIAMVAAFVLLSRRKKTP